MAGNQQPGGPMRPFGGPAGMGAMPAGMGGAPMGMHPRQHGMPGSAPMMMPASRLGSVGMSGVGLPSGGPGNVGGMRGMPPSSGSMGGVVGSAGGGAVGGSGSGAASDGSMLGGPHGLPMSSAAMRGSSSMGAPTAMGGVHPSHAGAPGLMGPPSMPSGPSDGMPFSQQDFPSLHRASDGKGSAESVPHPGAPASQDSTKYGLMGLLDIIRLTNRDVSTLALGTDLTTLGLNIDSAESLYATFGSPWADTPSARDPQFTLPSCYQMMPPALKTGHLSKFLLETLFYIFYGIPRDMLQSYAAQELYARNWRYHKDMKLWFCSTPEELESLSAPKDAFVYFDITSWEKRVFPQSTAGLAAGFLSEEEAKVKLQ